MRLIKIDPTAQTVEAVETNGQLQDLYQLIGCRTIDVCARQPNGDALTVDDEALLDEPQPPAFVFNGYGPIHGRGPADGLRRRRRDPLPRPCHWPAWSGPSSGAAISTQSHL